MLRLFVMRINSFQQFVHLVSLLPGHEILPTHVAEGGKLTVDGLAQAQLLDNSTMTEVENFLYCLAKFIGGDSPCAESLHQHRHWVCHAYGVGQFDLGAAGQSSRYHVLDIPAGGIGGRPIYFGGIFAGESAAT